MAAKDHRKHKSERCCLCVFCALWWLTAAWSSGATTRYVWQGSPSPALPYTSWATAAHVIQDAVDAAAAGDEIVVTDGNYGPVNVSKPLVLQSVNGAEHTIINGAGQHRCATLSGRAIMNRFALTDGFAPDGGGVQGGTLNNCTLTRNVANGGHDRGGGGAFRSTLNSCTLTYNNFLEKGG